MGDELSLCLDLSNIAVCKSFFMFILRLLWLIILLPLAVVNLMETFDICKMVIWPPCGQYQWFGIGIAVYLLLGILFRNRLNWLLVFAHELAHSLVGLLMFARVESFEATDTNGGRTQYRGGFPCRIFIQMAPYCLPYVSYFFAAIRMCILPKYIYIFDALIGLTLAFHVNCFCSQTSVRQTDLKDVGIFRSFAFIATFLPFNISVLLLTIRVGLFNAFVDYCIALYDKAIYIYTDFAPIAIKYITDFTHSF